MENYGELKKGSVQTMATNQTTRNASEGEKFNQSFILFYFLLNKYNIHPN